MTQTWKKIATVSLAAVMLTGSLAGCGKKAVSIDKENPSINVMTKAYNTESASPDSPVLQKLEEFLGTKLNITWVNIYFYNVISKSIYARQHNYSAYQKCNQFFQDNRSFITA